MHLLILDKETFTVIGEIGRDAVSHDKLFVSWMVQTSSTNNLKV